MESGPKKIYKENPLRYQNTEIAAEIASLKAKVAALQQALQEKGDGGKAGDELVAFHGKAVTTAADVDNLLSCLFTVTTLLIGFMTNFIGGQTYDYLIATDNRWLSQWSNWDHSFFFGSNDQIFLFSALLGFRFDCTHTSSSFAHPCDCNINRVQL